MISRRSSVTLAAALAVLACAPVPPDTAADEQAIGQARDREVAAINAGDVDAMVASYTDDIIMMPPNEPAVTGSAALRTWVQAMMDQVTAHVAYTESHVTVAGDWAVEHYAGSVTMTPKAGGDAMHEVIKGIHVYRREADGGRRIAQDIWNADAAPGAH